MDAEELSKVLESHQRWLNGKEGGARADLTGVDLHEADLTHANLRDAKLIGADLIDANNIALRQKGMVDRVQKEMYTMGALIPHDAMLEECPSNVRTPRL